MRLKLVAVAVAALAPVAAMLAYNEFAIRSQRNEELRATAAQAARQASSEVDRIIEGLHSLLIAVTSMPAVRELDAAACSRALTSVASNVPNVRVIFVVDLRGTPVCASQNAPDGVSFADREYFQQAIANKDFVVGSYTRSRISEAAVLPVAMPVIVDGAPKAVVVSGVRLDWLQNRIAERGVAPGNAVTIADGDGTILARVPLPEQFVGTVIPEAYQRLIHADRPGVLEVMSQDGTERVLGYRPVALPQSPLYVSAGFSKVEAFAPINRAMRMNSLAIVGGALFSFLAALFIGNRLLLSPISRIAGVMESWRKGEAAARTGMKPFDEIHAVGSTLDDLLDELDCRRRKNEEAEEERALLVRELAHRVKNGFTLVQAISRHTFSRSDPERYQSFSERLSALASTYDLLLSKDATASSVREIVSTALSAHSGSDEGRVHMKGPEVVLPADLALPLSLVLHELATNATKYGSLGSERGTAYVEWKHDGRRLHLTWAEAGGPPVDPPTRKGFGSVLIERAFRDKARARCRVDYRPEGLLFEIVLSTEESGVDLKLADV